VNGSPANCVRNTESQPAVAGDSIKPGVERSGTPGTEDRRTAARSELRIKQRALVPQGFKANPGLELANAFSIISTSPHLYFDCMRLSDNILT
jgi:hypothetical protein